MTATALAQDVYYGDLTYAENLEVRQWSEHYRSRVTGESASPGTGFSFTSPLLNSHLFNPVRSGRPTLEALNLIGASDCDGAYTPEILNSAPLDDYRLALRDLMLYGEITTELGTPENWYHELLILAADPDLGWLVFDDLGQLITIDLPVEEVSGVAHDASLEFNVSTQSQQIIATMIAAGQHWRNQCTDVPQWRALITGETSTAEQFRAQVVGYLQSQNGLTYATYSLDAAFGVFGELPVLAVQLSDCYILLDSTNGNMSGPFELGSPIDARELLQLHAGAFQAGTDARYYSQSGCTIPVAAWYSPLSWPALCFPRTVTVGPFAGQPNCGLPQLVAGGACVQRCYPTALTISYYLNADCSSGPMTTTTTTGLGYDVILPAANCA